MAVRSRRLWGGTRLTVGAYQVIYTVPADRTAVVRTIFMCNVSGSASWPVSLRINSSTGVGLLFERTLAPSETYLLEGVILNPGDVLRGRSNAASTPGIDCFGFGSLLLGAPV